MVLLVIRIETISWSPRAFIYHNFLSEAECDHLTDIGNKRVRCLRRGTCAPACQGVLGLLPILDLNW